LKSRVQELSERIEDIKVVDVHNHLNPTALSLRSYEDVIFYEYIMVELRTAGMREEILEKERGPKKLEKALPHLRFLRNTTTYWSLLRILKDLYGFQGNNIDENNWRDVIELLEAKRCDEEWAKSIIKDRARISKSILTFSPLDEIPIYDPEIFSGTLRMDPIIPNLSRQSLQRLEEILGFEITTPQTLSDALTELVKKFSKYIVSVTININSDENYLGLIASEKDIKQHLMILRNTGVIDKYGRAAINAYLLNRLMEICDSYKLTVQLMLGVRKPVPGSSPPDYAITAFNPSQLIDLTTLFARYPEIKFDVFIADKLLNHPLAVISKNYPNVFLSGYWWYSMYPETIKSYLRMRLQILPYNKMGGFFSDACVAEWVYGRTVLIKKQIAHVLAEMISEGYINQDTALEISEALLHENSERIYKLR